MQRRRMAPAPFATIGMRSHDPGGGGVFALLAAALPAAAASVAVEGTQFHVALDNGRFWIRMTPNPPETPPRLRRQ
jgi:hypothetical protein